MGSDFQAPPRDASHSPDAAADLSADYEINLVELFFRIVSSWRALLLSALACALAVGLCVFYVITPMYEATSTIYVLGQKNAVVNFSDLQIGSALTKDYAKILGTWEVQDEVIRSLGLPYSYEQLKKMVSVKNSSDTRMLDIAVSSPSPVEAASIANEYAAVAQKYISDLMATNEPNIVSRALAPANPVSPHKVQSVIIGFILGFLLGAGVVTIRFLADDRIKTADDIRNYLALTNLAAIPQEKGAEQSAGARNSKKKSVGRGRF